MLVGRWIEAQIRISSLTCTHPAQIHGVALIHDLV